MNLRWSSAARSDLRDILLRIADADPQRAESFIGEITRTGEKLLDAPRGYPVVPGLGQPDLRHRVYRGYLIFYRVTKGAVVVLRVLHGRRDYHSLLELKAGDD